MKLFIPLLCYNHTCNTSFMMSFLRFLLTLRNNNIQASVHAITFESLISRGRNAAIAQFISDPEATHILFIDSDIEFESEDVFKLIQADKEVICAGYAQKWLREDMLQNVFKRTTVPERPLELCTFTSVQVGLPPTIEEVMEIYYATTGFLLIKREAIEKMIQAYPERKYINDIDGYQCSNPDAFYDFFPATIEKTTRKFESEDFGFSRLWRECGGQIFVHTNITLKHHGWYGFPANIYRQMLDKQEQANKKEEMG